MVTACWPKACWHQTGWNQKAGDWDSTIITLLLPVAQSCPTLCNPMDCSTPGFPVLYYRPEFAQTMSIESMMLSNHLILCCLFLLLPSVFPSIRIFSNELALHIRWPKYWGFSFSISPSSEHSELISFRIDWFNLLAVQGTLKSSSAPVWKHQFFSAQPSLWSNSHIRTPLMEKPQLWLYGPLVAKWWLWFSIHCLGLS